MMVAAVGCGRQESLGEVSAIRTAPSYTREALREGSLGGLSVAGQSGETRAEPGWTTSDKPPELPPLEAPATAASVASALTEPDMDAVLAAAGWPAELWGQAKAVSFCESRWSPGAVGDSGNSVGLFQLWTGWFPAAGYSVAEYADPVVNASVALYVRSVRGRWGGQGGWTCADMLGIP